MGNALHTPGTPGVGAVSPADARLDDAGLIAAGATLLEPRTGVLYGPGAATLLTGTSDTAPMTVAIAAHHWVTSRQASDGVYRGANEQAGRKVNIGAAPGGGAGDRIDVVYVKQGDPQSTISTGHATDATAAPVYGVLAGTPGSGKPSLAAIPGAEELGTVTVSPGAVATNGAGVAIANTARLTVARGAPIPVRSQAERDAITTYPGHPGVIRLDTGMREDWSGAAWLKDPRDWPVAHVYQSAAQIGLPINWNTITMQSEVIDTHNGHASGATWTVPAGQGGTYHVGGVLILPSVASGTVVGVRAIKNGVLSDRYLSWFGTVGAGPVDLPLVVPPLVLAAGDTVAMQGYVNVAGWSTSAGADFGSWLSVERVR